MLTRAAVVVGLLAVTSVAHADPPDDPAPTGDPASDEGPSLPAEDARGLTRDQAVEVYVGDCHATLEAAFIDWHYEEPQRLDECLAVDVYQNCSPDSFGCFEGRERCERACQPVCRKCQDTCASGCDGCKAACAPGDAACVRRCAEARADCRGRCVTGLRSCQSVDCVTGLDSCWNAGRKRLASCRYEDCTAYSECLQEDRNDERCARKVPTMTAFCRRACDGNFELPFIDEEIAARFAPPPPVIGKELAGRCTAESQCPADYAAVAPFLAAFCGGALDSANVGRLADAVARGRVSKRTLGLVFNAYAAMYGYEFKRELWMNGFFYGAGGDWLPPSCKAKVRSIADGRSMPPRLTVIRDRVKRVWDAAK